MLTIRLADDGDLEAIGPLYARAFGGRAREAWEARRQWQYRANPAAAQVPRRVLVALDDGRVVGSLGSTPWRLKAGASLAYGTFTGDLMVAPEARGMGVAKRLYAAMLELVTGFDVCAFYNPATGHIAERTGWTPVGAAGRLMRVLDPGRVAAGRMANRLGNGTLARAAAAVAGAAGSLAAPFLKAPHQVPPSWRVERLASADARIDDLWNRASPSIPVLGPRDAAFVQWRYFDLPGCDHHVYAAGSSDGTLRGYLALALAERDGVRAAYLLDLLCPADDGEALSVLAAVAEREARALGAAVILTAGLFPAARAELRRRRWIARPVVGPMLIYWRGDPALLPLVNTESNWSLSLADGDDSFAVSWRGS